MLIVNQLSIQRNKGQPVRNAIYRTRTDHRTEVLINHISFKLRPGEILGIIGASGSGKSLLANSLLGSVPKGFDMSGLVYFDPVYKHPVALAAQSLSVLNPSTKIGKQLSRMAAPGVNIDEVLISARLSPEIKQHYPHELSGGMAKRVLSVMAVVQQTPYIIVDEPSSGLDPDIGLALFRYFQQMAEQGKGVMIISHDLPLIMTFAERILVLHQGQVVEETCRDAIFSGQCTAYTKMLWQAIPANWSKRNTSLC